MLKEMNGLQGECDSLEVASVFGLVNLAVLEHSCFLPELQIEDCYSHITEKEHFEVLRIYYQFLKEC